MKREPCDKNFLGNETIYYNEEAPFWFTSETTILDLETVDVICASLNNTSILSFNHLMHVYAVIFYVFFYLFLLFAYYSVIKFYIRQL